MDWARAIERNSEALKGIVAELFAMLGLAGEATVERIPQPLHSAVLRVLRPAESAVRRLIIIAARGLVVKLAPSRPMPMPGGPIGKGGGSRPPSFQLFDTRKNFAELRQHRVKYTRNPPRIHFFPYDSLRPASPPAALLLCRLPTKCQRRPRSALAAAFSSASWCRFSPRPGCRAPRAGVRRTQGRTW